MDHMHNSTENVCNNVFFSLFILYGLFLLFLLFVLQSNRCGVIDVKSILKCFSLVSLIWDLSFEKYFI